MFIAALFIIAKGEETQASMTDKQNVVCIYNGILFSLRKEGNSDICYNMNEPKGLYAKWNKPSAKGQVLRDSFFMIYLE